MVHNSKWKSLREIHRVVFQKKERQTPRFPLLIYRLPALQCGHATAIKVSKQALKERRPPWPMEITCPKTSGSLCALPSLVKRIESVPHVKVFQMTLQVVVLLSLRTVSSSISCQRAFCVILIHMLISVVK